MRPSASKRIRFTLRTLVLLLATCGSGYALWAHWGPWRVHRLIPPPPGRSGYDGEYLFANGTRFLGRGTDRQLFLLDANSLEPLATVYGVSPPRQAWGKAYMAIREQALPGKKAVTDAFYARAVIDLRTGSVVHRSADYIVAIDQDGSTLLAVNRADRQLVFRDFKTGETRWRVSDLPAKVERAGIESALHRVWALLKDGRCHVFDAVSGKRLAILHRAGFKMHWARWFGDPNRVMTRATQKLEYSEHSVTDFWDLETGTSRFQLSGIVSVYEAANRAVANDLDDEAVSIHDLETGKKIPLEGNAPMDVVLFPKSPPCLVGENTIRVGNPSEYQEEMRSWSMADGHLMWKYGPYPYDQFGVNRMNGKLLTYGGGKLALRDMATGRLIHEASMRVNYNDDIALFPDRRRLLINNREPPYHTHIVDADSLELLTTIPHSHGDRVTYKEDMGQLANNDHLLIYRRDASPKLRIYRRTRPEWWWGVFYLKELWLTLGLALSVLWSLRRDRNRL